MTTVVGSCPTYHYAPTVDCIGVRCVHTARQGAPPEPNDQQPRSTMSSKSTTTIPSTTDAGAPSTITTGLGIVVPACNGNQRNLPPGLTWRRDITRKRCSSVVVATDATKRRWVVKLFDETPRDPGPGSVLIEDPLKERNILQKLSALGRQSSIDIMWPYHYMPGSMVFPEAEQGDLHGALEDGWWCKEVCLPDRLRGVHGIFRAVKFLHAHGVAHRDISAENILVTDGGRRLLLTDMGQALCSVDGPPGLRPFDMVGKVAYRDPDQHRGREYSPFAADVFALGVVLFLSASGGTPPFESASDDDPVWSYLSLGGPSMALRLDAVCQRWGLGVDNRVFPVVAMAFAERVTRPDAALLTRAMSRLDRTPGVGFGTHCV